MLQPGKPNPVSIGPQRSGLFIVELSNKFAAACVRLCRDFDFVGSDNLPFWRLNLNKNEVAFSPHAWNFEQKFCDWPIHTGLPPIVRLPVGGTGECAQVSSLSDCMETTGGPL
mgnify:CR=1 FL=1